MLLTRRDMLRAAAAGAAALALAPARAASSAPLLVAQRVGAAGAASLGLWNGHATPLAEFGLPARVHAVTPDPAGGRCIAVARRPGRFGLVVDLDRFEASREFEAGDGRHFFGHGSFADDGRLFLTSENDIEAGEGVVGIRDVRRGFRQVAEWRSHGVGPHDIALAADGRSLWVANGGIDMSPWSGRAKLNEDTIVSTLTRLDIESGRPEAVVTLGDDMASLSIRHIAVAPSGTVCFGCEETVRDGVKRPLVGAASPDGTVRWFSAPPKGWSSLGGVIGDIALDDTGTMVAATGTRGGLCAMWTIADGTCRGAYALADCCAIGGLSQGFVVASGYGGMISVDDGSAAPLLKATDGFDNHLAVV